MVSAYFFAFFQNHLTLYILPHVISGKMIFQENPCPHVLWNMQLAKKYFIYYFSKFPKIMSDFVAPNTEYMKGLTKVKEKMIKM